MFAFLRVKVSIAITPIMSKTTIIHPTIANINMNLDVSVVVVCIVVVGGCIVVVGGCIVVVGFFFVVAGVFFVVSIKNNLTLIIYTKCKCKRNIIFSYL